MPLRCAAPPPPACALPDIAPRPAKAPAQRWLFAVLALLTALPLMIALWSAVALWLGAPAAWMAVVVAADATLLLHLLRIPPGPARLALALAFVVIAVAASLWIIVAGVVGPAFGLLPWESALRLGPVLFTSIAGNWWTLANAA